jgi:hypothetical protein
MTLAEHYGLASHLGEGLRTVERRRLECFSVEKKQMPELGLAQPDGVLKHCIENGFKLAGRGADDAQYICGRRLLLKRFAQFVQQPRILNGDNGLVSKDPEKRNLLIRKRINFGTSKLECSDRHSLMQQWDTSDRPMSEPPRHGASFGKLLGLRLEVNYMNGLPLENDAACNTSTCARETKTL